MPIRSPIDYPQIVSELIQLNVALFLSPGVQVTQALVASTSTIPIIATTPDLLSSGFVTSLARPGGNVTGMSLTAGPTLGEKWLEILKETFPTVKTVAILTASGVVYLDRIKVAAAILGVDVRYFTARDPQDIERALSEIAAMGPDGLVVESDANLVSNRSKIISPASSTRGVASQHTLTASSRGPNLVSYPKMGRGGSLGDGGKLPERQR